jgi:PAS domain S-box-containing protein
MEEIPSSPVDFPNQNTSPRRNLLILIIGIFLAEIIAMTGISLLPSLPFSFQVLLDAILMTAIIYPLLYFLSTRPLLTHIAIRKSAEKSLLQAYGRLQQLQFIVEKSPAMAFLYGAEASLPVEFVSENVSQLGYHAVDFLSGKLKFSDIVYPEDMARLVSDVSAFDQRSLSEFDQEFRILTPSGEIRWLGGRNWVRRDLSGRPTHYQGILLDTTDRKVAEDQLAWKNLELQRLTTAEHNQRQLAEALVQVALALNSNLNLDDLLDRILEQIQRVIPCTASGVALLDHQDISLLHLYGPADFQQAFKHLNYELLLNYFPTVRKVVETLEPCLMEDIREYKKGGGIISGFDWINSFIIVPLKTNKNLIGFMSVLSDQPGYFNEESVQILMSFTAHAELSIQNARVYQAELQARQTAEILRSAGLALTRTLDIATVMNTLMDMIDQLVPYDRSSVLLGEDPSQLHLYQTHEKQPSSSAQFEFQNHPFISTVFATGESLLVRSVEESVRFGQAQNDLRICSWLGVPFKIGQRIIGICVFEKAEDGFYNEGHMRLAEVLAAQASTAVQNAWLFEQLLAGRERLQLLSRRLVEIQENERLFIARELHDEAGQALATIMFGLQSLEKENKNRLGVVQRIGELQQITKGVLENLHRLAVNLRPASLDHLGLIDAVQQYIKSIKVEGLSIQFKAIGLDQKRLGVEVETALYRIMQEALANVARYAHANRADVLLELREDHIVLVVEDDGVGFDPKAVNGSHLGLTGMQERAEMLGGSLEIETSTGSGTTLVVEVPYNRANFPGG